MISQWQYLRNVKIILSLHKIYKLLIENDKGYKLTQSKYITTKKLKSGDIVDVNEEREIYVPIDQYTKELISSVELKK